MQNTFNFSKAMELILEGKAVSRVQFRDTCHIRAQFPDTHSKMTKPYLYMIKKSKSTDDMEAPTDMFPVDLSCESIFAEDWYIVKDSE